MHYPVNVFTGKVRKYEGSRPSAIAKVQVDGELTLTELGLAGDSRPKRKSTAGPIARCATIRASTISTGKPNFLNRRTFSSPRVWRKSLNGRADGEERLYWRYLSLGRCSDSGHPAALAVLQT